jgi:DNA-binding HxlR family transcriptional regulator
MLCIVGTVWILKAAEMARNTGPEIKAIRTGERCPMVDFVNLVSGKWAIPILYRLIVANRPLRFGELQRAVMPITQKELTRQLRLFEQRGLVRRTVYAEMPPRVEYEATPLAGTLRDTLDSLAAWMRANGSRLS